MDLRRLILLSLLLHLLSPSAMAAIRCPDCGSTAVPYPLSTSPTCGDPDYAVVCNPQRGTLTFPTLNNSYTINSIFPRTHRLHLLPSALSASTCISGDFSTQGVQLNASLPFNISNSNTVLYLNCSNTLLSSPLNCSSNSLCHSYVNSTKDGSVCANAPVCCTFKTGGSATTYSIRIRDTGCKAYRCFVNLDPNMAVTAATTWPDPRIEIQWVPPPEPLCTSQANCTEGRNSTCRPDTSAPATSRCFCNSPLRWDNVNGFCAEVPTCLDPNGCRKSKAPLIAGLVCGIGAAAMATAVCFLLYRRHRRIKEAKERLAREREAILNSGGGRSAKVFTGKEIKKATNNFASDRLLGVGGYGEVYKGVLNDGTVVAIKCAKLGNTKGTDQVLNEVRILCQVNHRSLVGLLGCCVELEQPLLVYEYIPNGTLYDHVRGPERKPLSWLQRLRVAHGTAEGLAYLHSSAVPPIYHRDVKSSNILLDEKMRAKVADFGLSRLAETDMSHISTCAQGTLGYLDPEYYRNYQLTDKSDVYSFGVVLLELLTSQKAIDFNREVDDVNLAIYVQRMVKEERLMEVVDGYVKNGAGAVEVDTMKALGFLAAGCLEEKRQNRPSMKEVVEEIEYIISIASSTQVSHT